MLYNNKSQNHQHDHHCDSHCNNIAHNHTDHGQPHSPTAAMTLDCGSVCSQEQTSHHASQDDDPSEEPPRLSSSEKISWHIQGMDCANCAKKIENSVKNIDQVIESKVYFSTEKLTATIPANTPQLIEKIESQISGLGYRSVRAEPSTHNSHAPSDSAPQLAAAAQTTEPHEHSAHLSVREFIPLALLAFLIALSYLISQFNPLYGEYAFIISAVIGVLPIAKAALAAARSSTPFTIESLMCISAIGALFIGAAAEASMVVFLFMIGELLEGIAANRARKGISSLMALMPEETTLLVDGQRRQVPSKHLKPDDRIEIASGGRLPADVILESEQATLDESALTGESIPVEYSRGAKILAGSLVVDKTVQFRVISEQGQNAVDRILQMIEEAEERKAPIERFIDRFSRYYTPSIALFALLVIVLPPLLAGADWYTWIYRGLTLLLIGCPCALVISTPAAITSALSSSARQGVLIKGGAALEALGQVKTIAFDKTGTLTEGKPQVTDVVSPTLQIAELLQLASAIEAGSSHPLAKAIISHSQQQGVTLLEADNRTAIAGIGVKGQLNQQQIYLLAPNKVNKLEISLSLEWQTQIDGLESQGKTVVVIVVEQTIMGLIALQDTLRSDTAAALSQLRQLGLDSIMLTGDNQRAASAIARQLAIEYRAELLPEDKLNVIDTLNQTQPVAMVGDGINDSPAMKAASVGIAMGSGSDVALETADAALTKNSLISLPTLIRIARSTNRIIKQNIAIALGFKALFLVTSLLGITGLWIAVLADSGTTAIVTANALRLLRKEKAPH